jgi:signal transduction histidine kinase
MSLTARPPMSAPIGPFESLLGTPLLVKLVVLDGLINVASFMSLQVAPPEQLQNITLFSLFGVMVLNAAFVAWALGPLRSLEDTARRVSNGEYTARAPIGRLADRHLARIASAFNRLLDRVATDRERVRSLASQVVAAGDTERAHIARELHDGAAQSLSALQMLVTATLKHDLPPTTRDRLDLVLEITTEVLGEVRSLSHGMHPRVLDDLGLAAALDAMVRRAQVTSAAHVELDVSGMTEKVPDTTASVLYRVTQEALHNALKHAQPNSVRVRAACDGRQASVEVDDDGKGFDPANLPDRGLGLFVMEERVGLLDGSLTVDARPGQGVRLRAVIPLTGGAP